MTGPRVAEELHWPDLSSPYADALRQVVDFLLEHFDLIGIVVSGSIVRGNPGPNSDFDIYVVHEQPWRQRVQRRFDGVPTEIFVNSPAAIRAYFESEHAEGRPSTAHMLATGFVVLDRAPVVAELRREAVEWLAKPWALTKEQRLWQCYAAIDTLDNAADLIDTDPENARLLLTKAVQSVVDYVFGSRGCFIPRAKERLTRLGELDPEAEHLVRHVIAEPDIAQQVILARRLAASIIGQTTFFEWESERQPFPPSADSTAEKAL